MSIIKTFNQIVIGQQAFPKQLQHSVNKPAAPITPGWRAAWIPAEVGPASTLHHSTRLSGWNGFGLCTDEVILGLWLQTFPVVAPRFKLPPNSGGITGCAPTCDLAPPHVSRGSAPPQARWLAGREQWLIMATRRFAPIVRINQWELRGPSKMGNLS